MGSPGLCRTRNRTQVSSHENLLPRRLVLVQRSCVSENVVSMEATRKGFQCRLNLAMQSYLGGGIELLQYLPYLSGRLYV